MTNTKTTKRALLASVLSLLLCISMLVGSTFAWFTDSASTSVNKIQAGTLDVGLVDYDGNSLEGKALSFADVNGNTDILWEPGATFVTQAFRVVNDGNLEFKYKIIMTGLEGDSKLLDVIEFTLVDEDGLTAALEGRSVNDKNGVWQFTFDENGKFVKTQIGRTGSKLMYVVAHMDEAAGNEYQGLTLEGIGITVIATQDTVENDSFNDQYDKDATWPEVITEETVEGIFGKGGHLDFHGAVVDGTDNSYFQDGSTIANLTFNSNSQGNAVRYAYIYGDVTFTNCEFNANGGYAFHVDDVVGGATGATITFENCSFNDWIAVSSDVAELKFVNCTFTDAAFVNSYQNATFENCTFTDAFTMDDELAGEQTWTFTSCTGLNNDNLNKTGSKSDVKIVIN